MCREIIMRVSTLTLLLASTCAYAGLSQSYPSSFASDAEQLSSSLDDFLSGLFQGLQDSPESPSACVASLPVLSMKYSELLAVCSSPFQAQKLFSALFSFNKLMDEAVSAFEFCKIQSLLDQLAVLPTKKGFGELLLGLGLHYSEILNNIEGASLHLKSENYGLAGVATGTVLRYLFNFSF